MKQIWYHVYNFSVCPAVSYGFAIDEKGICIKAHDKISGWAIGKSIDWIKKFYESKNVNLIEIKG